MTQPACPSLPPEGRFTFATPEFAVFPADSDDEIMISCTCKREALNEVVLIRVSLKILRIASALVSFIAQRTPKQGVQNRPGTEALKEKFRTNGVSWRLHGTSRSPRADGSGREDDRSRDTDHDYNVHPSRYVRSSRIFASLSFVIRICAASQRSVLPGDRIAMLPSSTASVMGPP